MRFEVHGLPQPKGSTRAVVTATGQARVFSDNAQLKQWEEAIGWSARAAGARLHDGAVLVEALFYLPRPQRPREEVPVVRPDLDKLVRAVLDALTGICYHDDAQVIAIQARKQYADHAGVLIAVSS